MRRLLTACLVSSALFVSACGNSGNDSKLSKVSASVAPAFDADALDDLMKTAVESGEAVAISALVYNEGQTVYYGGYGLRDREREQPVTRDTVWRIYSMTKTVTSAVIMDLIEEGKINLTDPVSKYIPALANMQVASLGEDGNPVFTPQANPMTVEDLLLHRAGLGYGIFGETNPVESLYVKAKLFEPNEDLSVKMTKLSQLPLVVQPGTSWYYSYATDVLGAVIESVTGQRLGEVFDARIFNPLGMNETGFHVRPDQKARFASNYMWQEDGTFMLVEDGQNSPFLEPQAYQSGGGGLVSTIDDYAKFAQMLLEGGQYNGHRVLEAETVKLMMSDHLAADTNFLFPWIGGDTRASFGYGGSVQISDTPEWLAQTGLRTGQFGWGGAARTEYWIDPKNNAFGIIMMQVFVQEDPDVRRRIRVLVQDQTSDQTSN